MSTPLSEELTARGFINQFSTQSLAEIIDTDEPRVIYHGIDPSADSAHAGNFVVWMLLRHLAQHGHKIIFLVGGGTGMIGDPKPDVERPLSDPAEVAARVEKLRAQAERLVGGDSVVFVNNYDWLQSLGLITFLRDIGKHFTVNELIKKDAIANRLKSENGISYTEFAYPLLQAYDYLELHRTYGCDLQVGGSDQWGNIIAGVELVRRIEHNTVHALTVPLIIDKVTGKKFGKSEGNAVWLDAAKTSPYEFYQFWFNTHDQNVIDYLKLFSLLSLEEIATCAATHAASPDQRLAQKTLAYEITALVHGVETAEMVARVSATLFGEVAITELSDDEKKLLETYAPLVEVSDGASLVDVVVAAALAGSKREARTFIADGAVTLNGIKLTDSTSVVSQEAVGEFALLTRGKKHRSLLRIR